MLRAHLRLGPGSYLRAHPSQRALMKQFLQPSSQTAFVSLVQRRHGDMYQQRRFCTTVLQITPEASDSQEEDSENFWRVPADRTTFWSAYVSTRPNYSHLFYDLIYAHHASHSSSWKVAHDVGCGAGQVTAELASRFEHVVASDNNVSHVTEAKRRLSPGLSDERVSYRETMGEHLAMHYPPRSADLIASAEAMVLMDEQAALKGFARMLRPGGTLAFWFYGRPTFADAKMFAIAQPLIDALMVHNWAAVIEGSGPKRQAGFKRAAEGMSSWLDSIWLNPSVWTSIRRIKWNTYGTLPFFDEKACGFPLNVSNTVADDNKVETIEDRNFWRNDWNLEQLKSYFRVLFPGFENAVRQDDPEIDRLYGQLELKMGNGTATFTWPVSLVMATRNDN